jgi:ABC-type multidrug transport system ATPase subunit
MISLKATFLDNPYSLVDSPRSDSVTTQQGNATEADLDDYGTGEGFEGGITRSVSGKVNRRGSLARRMSLDGSALLGSLGKSKKNMDNDGITFEVFAVEFFKMMVNKKKSDSDEVTDPNVRGVQIQFTNLCLHIKLGGKEFKVLDDVNGKIEEKTMVGLMGGSGAGKTSLLNALCGRAYYGRVSGEILVNGKKGKISDFQDYIGFVPQDDTVHGDLSVYENLIYSGRFRLPVSTTFDEIDELAIETLEDMQLVHVRDSLVGDVGKRGVSGGQRKRVNIGVELMARPKLLFLDEPTSGLDANSSSVALSALRRLSRRGTTVVMVIHQPRYGIFQKFDKICILAKGGKMVYEGAPGKVVDVSGEYNDRRKHLLVVFLIYSINPDPKLSNSNTITVFHPAWLQAAFRREPC